MDKKELEEKLEQEIKNFNEVPTSVDDKIQKAFMKIDAKKENKVSKFNLGRITKLVAEITTIAFLAGNGVAFATGNPNIYSWVLNKIGIQKEYEEIKTNINQTVVNNEIKMTLLDLGYDENCLIIGYKLENEDLMKCAKNGEYELDDNIDYKEFKDLIENGYINYDIEIGDVNFNNSTCIEENELQYICLNSNEELVIYIVCDISNKNLNNCNDMKIVINNFCFSGLDDTPVYKGDWEFNVKNIIKNDGQNIYNLSKAYAKFKIEKEYGSAFNSLTNKMERNSEPTIIVNDIENIGMIKIDKIQTSRTISIITISTNYTYGPMIDEDMQRTYYDVEIIDSDGNIIVDKVRIEGTYSAITKKMEENKNYTINVYKYSRKQVPEDEESIEYELIKSSNFYLIENEKNK